ncbi:hypothetical protein BASA61_003126 [Batrachochytrium salamandrivorans]|nr:hypothetical protein BASA61_003126 [Batrachochytrium salamandrivorans]
MLSLVSRKSIRSLSLRPTLATRYPLCALVTSGAANSTTANKCPVSIGIRREGKNRWERRVPLVPSHVLHLTKDLGATVYIQPSSKRVISDDLYRQAGAIVQDDLSAAHVIVGVKEVPVAQLIKDKTYIYFSHTHKAQKYNMPMLQNVLDKKIRLIDYELMTNEDGSRLVQFSRFAGYAGMIDTLYAVGHRLLGLGYGSPFLSMGMTHQYRSLEEGCLDVAATGDVIKQDGIPKQLGPMVFVFVGGGNVAQGALHVFEKLPHEWVSSNDLAALASSTDFDHRKLYACKILPEDYLVRKDGGEFVCEDYFKNPEQYKSIFHEKIAPYASVIVNGMFWTEKYPRLMTIDQTHQLASENNLRLLTLSDISCDINGPFEFMSYSSTIDTPTFMYDPVNKSTHHSVEGRGIQIMSIDNLPTELPLEASEYFSTALVPFISELAKGNADHPVIQRAAITTTKGELVDKYKHLKSSLPMHGHSGSAKVTGSKKVLLLGSGFVAGPLVDYLLRTPGTHVTIASNAREEAMRLSGGRDSTSVLPLDVSNKAELSNLVSGHDVVVSFVPASLHPVIAEQCLEHKKNLVTASYISPAMAAFDQRAKDAGLAFVNEVGLDPGIDHLTACQLFNQVKSEGGRITSFVSWCGGLPAPETSDNPLGYKFSWSPKGVLLAGLNSAKFKMNGKMYDIPGSELMRNVFDVPIFKGFAFEGVANRDSLAYADLYNLGELEGLTSMFRGTLRYKGYAEIMGAFNKLGLLDTKSRPELRAGISWGKLLQQMVGTDVHNGVAKKLALNPSVAPEAETLARVISSLKWLGITSDAEGADTGDSVLDAFCALLQRKLVYGPGERDMVAMHHVFGIQTSSGKKETRTSTMIAYGDPAGYSAMALTVGLPAAIATEMVLNGSLKRRGVIAPMSADIYEPMLTKLEREVPGLPRDTSPIRGLMYADDVAVFADSEQSLLAASTAIEQWANWWEMQFGVTKCGIISFTGHLAPRLDNPLDIRLHGQLVSRVESYKYLGVLIDSKLDHSAWLKQKRSALEHTISALHSVLANHQLTVNYRSRIFSAVVMGKAYYGLELVGGNKSHLAPLQTTINKGIRLFTGARLSTAIGLLLVETGIGSLFTRSLVSRLVRSQRWFWSRRTKQLYRNRYWLTPQVRPKTVKQRHSFALMETLQTCGDSASLQKYVTRQLLDTCGFFKDPSFDQSRAHGTRYLMLARMDAL